MFVCLSLKKIKWLVVFQMNNLIQMNPEELERIVRDSIKEGLEQFQELKHSQDNIDQAYIISQTYAIKRFIDLYLGVCS